MLNDRLHIEYTISYTIMNGYMLCNTLQSPVMADHDTSKHFQSFKHHFSSINIQAFTQNEKTKNEQKKITYLKCISTKYLLM